RTPCSQPPRLTSLSPTTGALPPRTCDVSTVEGGSFAGSGTDLASPGGVPLPVEWLLPKTGGRSGDFGGGSASLAAPVPDFACGFAGVDVWGPRFKFASGAFCG